MIRELLKLPVQVLKSQIVNLKIAEPGSMESDTSVIDKALLANAIADVLTINDILEEDAEDLLPLNDLTSPDDIVEPVETTSKGSNDPVFGKDIVTQAKDDSVNGDKFKDFDEDLRPLSSLSAPVAVQSTVEPFQTIDEDDTPLTRLVS